MVVCKVVVVVVGCGYCVLWLWQVVVCFCVFLCCCFVFFGLFHERLRNTVLKQRTDAYELAVVGGEVWGVAPGREDVLPIGVQGHVGRQILSNGQKEVGHRARLGLRERARASVALAARVLARTLAWARIY